MTNMSNREFLTIVNCNFVLTMVVRFHREVLKFSSDMAGGSTITYHDWSETSSGVAMNVEALLF